MSDTPPDAIAAVVRHAFLMGYRWGYVHADNGHDDDPHDAWVKWNDPDVEDPD